MNDSLGGEDDELEGEEVHEGRVPFDRPSLDKYRASSPSSPSSLVDDLRAVIQQYADRNTLRLCRKGRLVIRPDGGSYRVACGNKWSCPLCSP